MTELNANSRDRGVVDGPAATLRSPDGFPSPRCSGHGMWLVRGGVAGARWLWLPSFGYTVRLPIWFLAMGSRAVERRGRVLQRAPLPSRGAARIGRGACRGRGEESGGAAS